MIQVDQFLVIGVRLRFEESLEEFVSQKEIQMPVSCWDLLGFHFELYLWLSAFRGKGLDIHICTHPVRTNQYLFILNDNLDNIEVIHTCILIESLM